MFEIASKSAFAAEVQKISVTQFDRLQSCMTYTNKSCIIAALFGNKNLLAV
jgi:hypothetical protein